MRALALVLVAVLPAGAVVLEPKTLEAFDRYVAGVEAKLETRNPFLWADESADRARRARAGEVVVEKLGSKHDNVPDGLVHDWIGATFIPGASLAKTIALVQDYNRHKEYFKPEVMDSRLLHREGNDFRTYLRLLKKKVITVVLNTEHEVHYAPVDQTRWRSVSRTTRIAEVENPGKPNEHELAPGTGNGFLWKLVSYWRFEERDGGTWVECEAISLTRDVPTGLGWVINPIVQNLPRQSLESTLQELRAALVR
jgi:hypothetical protein